MSSTTPGVDAGITYSQTPSLDGIVVRDPEPTATGLWTQLTDPWNGAGLTGAITTAVRELVTDESPVEVHTLLDDLVGNALDGALANVLRSLTGESVSSPILEGSRGVAPTGKWPTDGLSL